MNTPEQTEIEERCWARTDRAVNGLITFALLAVAGGLAVAIWS